MVLDLDLSTFTLIHAALSVIAVLTGFVVFQGLLRSQRLKGWTALFLLSAIATSATGLGFPTPDFDAAKIVGITSLVALGIAALARYLGDMEGMARWLYALSAMVSLYLLVFVLIVQLFQKVPALKALAPTQSEPPFVIAQGAGLGLFLVLTILAVRKFHPSGGFSPQY